MKNVLCAAVAALTLCLCSTSMAQPQHCKPLTGQLENRIYQLPADGGAQYLTIVGAEHDPKFVKLKQAFSEQGELTGVRDATHFTVLPTSGAMYQSRYASDYEALPAVRLQSPSGEVLYEAAGEQIPETSELYAELQARCDASCFKRQDRATPSPQPTPYVAPDVKPVVKPVVKRGYLNAWQRGVVVGAALLVGFGLGVARIVAPEWAA